MIDKFSVKIFPSIYGDGFVLWIVKREVNERGKVVRFYFNNKFTWKILSEDTAFIISDQIILKVEDLPIVQKLVAAVEDSKILRQYTELNNDELRASSKHLGDMRKIVFHLLKIGENENAASNA